MSDSAVPTGTVVVTCALTGVLTDPNVHQVPVTPEQMADHAEQAYNAGASIVHLHFRDQRPGMGRLPSWDPAVAKAISDAIRARCPDLIQNFSTGIFGSDISGPLACLEAGRPEMAALNAGTLNYLKLRAGGEWAWPPLLFDNPVSKIEAFLAAMNRLDIVPECECFD
ncbi:MAG: 3-keto-5-aminohexanoate cleavage protein, partial [Deltaproteobacteria bacterium]|nr:3-keto-5-aminohexanoate cleavage protein [Deltaproteobacteria bacterium]